MKIGRVFSGIALQVAIAAVYFAGGKLGLSLAFLHPSATPVWPPTGIALAAILLFGPRVLLAVFVAAFLVNFSTAGTVATSLGIAAGNALEALVGGLLLRRFAHGADAFKRARDVVLAVVLAGIIAPMVSATFGVATLAAAGLARPVDLQAVWLTWWLGDAAGALVVTPFLVLWAREPRVHWVPLRVLEAAALYATIAAAGLILFGDMFGISAGLPIESLCIPLVIWVAFRFGPRETATVTLALASIAVAGTMRGYGPFVGPSPNESLLLLQTFMAVLSVTGLAISAVVADRGRFAARLRAHNLDLERSVAHRTAELAREASDHARTGAVLRALEERLIEAQQVARIGSWEWDVAADRVWWSDELYRLYGVDPSTFGASFAGFLDCVHPDDRDLVRTEVRRSAETGEPFQYDHRIVRPSGEIRTVEARGRVVVDAAGQPVRMLGTGQDVTELRSIEEQRAQLRIEQAGRREAEQANRQKDEFLAMLSHELRTPLQAMMNWAQLLRQDTRDAERTHRGIEVIERNLRLQARLVADLLDVSRINSGRLEVARESVELRSVIAAAAETLGPVMTDRGVALRVAIDEAGAGRVLGDADRLQQVIWNLVSNAVKFAPPGGAVEVRAAAEGREVVIRVEDDGPGIDPDFLPHVFEQFRRRDPAGTRSVHGGLGLGLAIARRLVELHGGTIHAANREGRSGAVFTVRLPVSDPLAPGAAHPADVPAEDVRGGLAGVRILLVEDDAESRETLSALLSESGATVTACRTASDGFHAAKSMAFDLLVSDIGLPDEDGYSFMRRVRALPRGENGAIVGVAISAYAGHTERLRSVDAGFDAHIAKPFRPAELTTLLRGLQGRPAGR